MRNPPNADDLAAAALLADADARVAELEARLRTSDVALVDVLGPCIDAVAAALRATIAAAGKAPPDHDADLLEVWQTLVKGEPTWNAIRDNCRELVYYRNCLAEDRRDALPRAPERMAVRTARHILLYIRTRAQRDGWSADA